MRRLRMAAVFVAALLVVSVSSSGLAAAHGTDRTPRLVLWNLKVLDDQGRPFAQAGIMAAPADGGDMVFGAADRTGRVRLVVNPFVRYEFTAFAVNTGWCDGWESPTGDVFHFSDPVDAYPVRLLRPTTFTVPEPDCPTVTTFTVLDGNGQPFTKAGVMAWPADGSGDGGADMITGGADPGGTVVLTGLDPDVEYEVGAYAIDTGWTCGYWTQPDTGEHFWFSTSITGTPTAVEGTTFTIPEPDCPTVTTFTVLDGNGQPFTKAGVMAWPADGSGDMVATGTNPDGTADLLGLDPDVEYEVTAFAIDTGWTCGYWTQPDTGEHFWFSTSITGTPTAVEGTTFTVPEPDCT